MKYTLPHRIWRAVADWIRAVILRKTATPYECYWRDRAFAAEQSLHGVRAELNEITRQRDWYSGLLQ